MKTTYTLKGINSDASECFCCGKVGLNRVVWLAMVIEREEGSVSPYGTTCAAKLLGIREGRKARIEKEIDEMLTTAIKNKISEIRASFTSFERVYLFPEEIVCKLQNKQISLIEAQKEREQLFPILGFAAGSISLNQAARYL